MFLAAAQRIKRVLRAPQACQVTVAKKARQLGKPPLRQVTDMKKVPNYGQRRQEEKGFPSLFKTIS